MLDNPDHKETVVSFLRSVIRSVETGELDLERQRFLSEFYLKFHFIESTNNSSREDIMKFLALGWYIYSMT